MNEPLTEVPDEHTEEEWTQLIEERPQPGTLLSELLERRKALEVERYYDVEVPGWAGCLVIRCGPVRGSVIQKLRERAEGSHSPDRDLNVNCDTLIAACLEVLVRRARTDELEPADPENGPLKLDVRCGELFQLGTTKAREVVRGLFAGANAPDLAIGAAAGEYINWATQAEGELDEEFLGEA